MGKPRAVTPETLGAWLIKGSRAATPIAELMRTSFSDVTGWCVRPTYRTDLVRGGQPVLFWLSGDDPTAPAGIYAQGVTLGSPTSTDADEAGGRLTMPVSLQPVEPPILRSWLLQHPALSQLEVLKMAAGSNPSYVTRDQVAELRTAWPHLAVGPPRAPGTTAGSDEAGPRTRCQASKRPGQAARGSVRSGLTPPQCAGGR